MPIASNSFRWLPLVLCLALGLPHAGQSLAQEPRRVMAEGSGPVSPGSPLWVVLVDPGVPSTRVVMREKFGDARDWVRLPELPARVGQIATHGNELVVVLDSPDQHPTQWAWFSQARISHVSYGPRLGRDTRILAMAGDRRNLWALGEPAPAAVATATRPAATQATHPVLHQLKGEKWIQQPVAWPDDLPEDAANRISMAVIQGRPMIAVPAGDALVRLLHLEAGAWTAVATVKVAPNPPEYFKVLELDQRPALWVQPPATEPGIGGIWVDGRYIPLDWRGGPPRPENVDVTVAGDQIRVFFKQGEQLMEQRYRLSGDREGEPIAITPVAVHGEEQTQWVTVAVLAVLSILILNTLMRRRAASKDEEREE